MELKKLEKILLSKAGAVKEFPFGEDAMVFKVEGKMFALIAWKENPIRITLKSLPEDAIGYRELYECVKEGYYMNKKHWNTITLDGSINDDVVFNMIDESYILVTSKITKFDKKIIPVKS